MTKPNRPLTPFGELQRGWGSMANLAREANVSLSTIRRLVYGAAGCRPYPATIARLAVVLGLDAQKIDETIQFSWQPWRKALKENRAREIEQEVKRVKDQREKERNDFLKRKKLVNDAKGGKDEA